MGEAKLANAIALGQTLKLKKMAVGDGNGTLPTPDRGQKALVREVHRADLNKLDKDPDNASQIIVEQVLPEDVGGWWIREIGIYDEAGDLCAVANCPPSYKPLMTEGSGRTQVVRIVLIVASTAAIELKIDPSIILATRQYVDEQIITVRAYSDAQLAKHLAAADPHPLLAKVAYVDQQSTSARAYGDQQLGKHLSADDPHPQLAQRSHVDQQDSSIVAYGEQQLAKHAAAADPHPQYSMKEVATLPKFDASKKLANAEFVQQSQGNIIGHDAVGMDRSLTPDDIGKALYFSAPNVIFTLPKPRDLGLSTNSGKCIHFFGFGGNTAKIVPGAGANISFIVGGVPFIELKTGQYLTLTAASDVVWQVIDSTAELWRNADFAAMVSSSGYQRLPSGTIQQVGSGAQTPESGYVDVIFPIPFPNECFHVFTGYEGQSGSGASLPSNVNAGMKTKTGCRLYTYNGNALSGGITPSYFAIGK
ncbi:phage tail protein [Janthinobacterium sp. SUN211]|uniref:phage tail protein n=1 Tax=Janthinobacterium sp. SUN211 TaxID=3014786 RepID=UPI0027123AEE|nr:phage tail protein [Janthinobacterium sp. SUN211]MDO8048477.1 phage tail protein [Janthinobacterium sp. SUN211]